MEKIKSILGGHKKEDEAHDAQISSTGAHQDSQTPIHDSMKGTSSTQPGSTDPSFSAGRATPSAPLGQSQQSSIGGPTGGQSTIAGDSVRPDVNPRGAGHTHEGMSEASIKSGIIGFGAGERQEHAALPSHNQKSGLNRSQIVGEGTTGHGPTTANTSHQPSTLKQALPLPGTATGDNTHNTTGQSSTSRQPLDQSLRQESYTNDTDRSFPLAGGVAPKHNPTSTHTTTTTTTTHHNPLHQSTSTQPIDGTSSSHHPTTSSREPGTKEKGVGVHDGHGREGLAGAAAAAAAVGTAGAFSQSHQRDTHVQGLETREATYGDESLAGSSTHPTSSSTTQNIHPEALAAATAAASRSAGMPPPAQTQGTGSHDTSFGSSAPVSASGVSAQPLNAGILAEQRPSGQRSESHRHIPGSFPSPTPDDSKTFLFYRDQVVPQPGVDGPVYEAHKGIHPEHLDRPHEFAGSHGHGHSPTAGTTGTGTATGVDPGQHELRHTGSLEDPTPRSETHDDHHHGRNAAIAGGVGAGAAGLGYAATRDHKAPSATDSNVSQKESSPYSSTQLDPRVLGSQAKAEEQRYDPQAASAQHTSPTSNLAAAPLTSHETHHDDKSEKTTIGPHKSSLLNRLDPRVKNDSSNTTDNEKTTTKQAEPESHHGRDAALAGAGAGGIGGAALARHEMQRNDTPGTGTAVLPQDTATGSSNAPLSMTTARSQETAPTSAPLSGSTTTAPHSATIVPHSTSTAPHSTTTDQLQSSVAGGAPLTGTTAASTSDTPFDTYHGPKTVQGTPFYGAVGAPAPVADTRPHESTNTSSTTSPLTQQHDKDHHYGRDAGLAGAGLATAGGLAHAGQRDDKASTGPASSTIGPHSSNTANVVDPRVQPDPSQQVHHNIGSTIEDPASRTIGPHPSNVANVLDPRVQSDPAKQKGHTTTGPHQSDTLNRMDPKVDEKSQHHYSRDAAVVGGTGAAGYGAYEAANTYGSHPSTQPSASMNEQRYDPNVTSTHAPNTASSQGQYDHDNTGRNVALGSGAALGVGALGGATYAGTRHADNTQMPATSSQPLSTQPGSVTQSHPTQGAFGHEAHEASSSGYPTQGAIAPQNTYNTAPGATQQSYNTTQAPQNTDHHKRDAALLGTGAAVAGGVGYAAYSPSQDAERMEKERQELLKEQQHAHDKEQKKLDKEAHKHEKEQNKHDKAVVAHDKHDKEAEKEAHRLEKEREKEAHRLEKEREKEAKRLDKESDTPEKKHGILGFLHRDKSKKEHSSGEYSPRQSEEVRRSVDNKRYSHDDYESTNPDSPRWKGKNKLHKDPPKGHPAREALEHHEMGTMSGGDGKHVGITEPVGEAQYRGVDARTGSGNVTSGYHENPHSAYGSGGLGDGRVVEPHTGLPMNVGQYGDGLGGTDASNTVHGLHAHESGAGAGAGSTTDWNAIKKADTPY